MLIPLLAAPHQPPSDPQSNLLVTDGMKYGKRDELLVFNSIKAEILGFELFKSQTSGFMTMEEFILAKIFVKKAPSFGNFK